MKEAARKVMAFVMAARTASHGSGAFNVGACSWAGVMIVLLAISLFRFAFMALQGTNSSWSFHRLMLSLALMVVMLLQLGLRLLRPTPMWERCSMVLLLGSIVLFVAPDHQRINECSPEDSTACQFLGPIWLIGSFMLLPSVALQSAHNVPCSWAVGITLAGLAISGLMIWLQPLFVTRSAVDIMEAFLMLGTFVCFAGYSLAHFTRRPQDVRPDLNSVSRGSVSPRSPRLTSVVPYEEVGIDAPASPIFEQRHQKRLGAALQCLARARFDAVVCLGSGFSIQTISGKAAALGLEEGECFTKLLVTDHQENVTRMLREVGGSEAGGHAVEICQVRKTKKVLRLLATKVGRESSGQGARSHVLLGVEALAGDVIDLAPSTETSEEGPSLFRFEAAFESMGMSNLRLVLPNGKVIDESSGSGSSLTKQKTQQLSTLTP